MAKQSLFSLANLVLLHVVKTMWHRTKIRKTWIQVMFNYNYLLERLWQSHCTQTCRYDAIGRCRAARWAELLQCSKCVFSFCSYFFPHSLTRGKNPLYPQKKTVLSPGKIRTQVLHRGLGRAGRAGQQWLAGQGWGPGLGQAGAGGGTCVFLNKNVHRNRLECCFGAVCWDKKTEFFCGFPWTYWIFPLIYRIFT